MKNLTNWYRNLVFLYVNGESVNFRSVHIPLNRGHKILNIESTDSILPIEGKTCKFYQIRIT